MTLWLLMLLGQVSASCRYTACSHFLYCSEGFTTFGCPQSWINGIAPGADTDKVSTNFVLCQDVTCLCAYVPLNDRCTALGSSGVTVGRGVDLQFIAGKPEMLAMGVAPELAEKLAPLVGLNSSDPIALAEANRLVLTKAEADSISTIVVNARLIALESYYNQNTGKTKFMELPKGIRTALLSFYYQNGGSTVTHALFWEAAFSQDWAALINLLNTDPSFQSRRQSEAQIVAAALRECTLNDIMDVVLVLDASGSIKDKDYTIGKNFLTSLVQNFTIGVDKTRVSFVDFSTSVDIRFYLNTYNSAADIINTITKAPKSSGSTNTGGAIKAVVENVLVPEKGRRNGTASCLTMVLTDGQSNGDISLAPQAPRLKSICSVMAIGIGSGIYQSELELIASQVSFVYSVSDFQLLIDGIQSMKKSVCLVPEYVTVEAPTIVRAPENVYRYFAIRVTSTGATVHCTPSEGDFYIYGSWVDPNPTKYSHDFHVESAKDQVMLFEIPKNGTYVNVDFTQAFMSLQGKDSNNDGKVELMDGLFCSDLKPMPSEGCKEKQSPTVNQTTSVSEGRLLSVAVLMVLICSN